MAKQKLTESVIYKPLCRICYSDTITESNPLIYPCNCTGSCRYIHLECLQKWLASKMVVNVADEESTVISILWEGLKCELCLKKLPLNYTEQGRNYELISFEKMFNLENFPNRYLFLESWGKDMKPLGLFFIDFSERSQVTLVL